MFLVAFAVALVIVMSEGESKDSLNFPEDPRFARSVRHNAEILRRQAEWRVWRENNRRVNEFFQRTAA